MKYRVILFIVAISVVYNSPVLSQVITVNVTGTINSVFTGGNFDCDESLVGSTMTGSCSYDPDNSIDLNATSYWGEYVVSAISMKIGNYTFIENPVAPNSSRFNVARADIVYNVETSDGIVMADNTQLDYTGITIKLFDLCNASVSGPNDDLPTTFPDPSFFNYRNEFVAHLSGEFTIIGVIDSITVVPEPVSIIFWGLGAYALRNRSMRKQ